MKIPGFTAEKSLYKKNESYCMSGVSTYIPDSQVILPQQQRIVCGLSGGRLHCGIEDDGAGYSYSWF